MFLFHWKIADKHIILYLLVEIVCLNNVIPWLNILQSLYKKVFILNNIQNYTTLSVRNQCARSLITAPVTSIFRVPKSNALCYDQGAYIFQCSSNGLFVSGLLCERGQWSFTDETLCSAGITTNNHSINISVFSFGLLQGCDRVAKTEKV